MRMTLTGYVTMRLAVEDGEVDRRFVDINKSGDRATVLLKGGDDSIIAVSTVNGVAANVTITDSDGTVRHTLSVC